MSYVHVLRGGLLESRHRVHLAAIRPDGSLLASVGEANFSSFLRSSAKAFQAIPLVQIMNRFKLEPQHLAVAMASHAGEDAHVNAVADFQTRAGIDPNWLVCGIHWPFNDAARAALRAKGQRPNVLHNNCSGKHTGMLAACIARGWPTEGYANADHPLQLEIVTHIKKLMNLEILEMGVDGCGVPCFRMPLSNAALGMAKLAAPDQNLEYTEIFETEFSAMRAHPNLIAGTGLIDTLLMRHVPNLASKIGAESFMLVAVKDSQHGPFGMAMKIEDGNERARDVAMLEILAQLGLLERHSANFDANFLELSEPILRNHTGLEVGQIRPAFELQFA
jgi:L-asparaginase II